jgi:hypothetical protein
MRKIILFLLTLLMPVLSFAAFTIPDTASLAGKVPTQPTTTPAGSGNQLFGYYKIGVKDADKKIKDMKDHANMVHITTADPFTASLEQFRLANPVGNPTNQKLIVEFGALLLNFRGQNGCPYQKCFVYDETRVNEILSIVREKIMIPFKNEVVAIYILDEPESNPITNASIQRLIRKIREYREFDTAAILINYDNVLKSNTGFDFFLPEGVNWVSVTPNFGRYCYGLCENGKYTVLLNAAEQSNLTRAANDKIKLLVIGDAWSESPDKDSSGITATGNNHLQKINRLYDTASSMAGERNIQVVGMLTFAYDWFDSGAYALTNSTPEIIAAWKAKARAITGIGSPVTPPPNPPVPNESLVKQFTSARASSVLWSVENLIDAKLDTVYSSQFNPTNPWFAAWLPQRKTVSKLELYARTKDGKPLGFPRSYRISVTSEDNSRWIPVSSSAYTIQPTDGKVTINFGRSYNTYGVLLSAEKLGLDDHYNPYLQMRDIQLK